MRQVRVKADRLFHGAKTYLRGEVLEVGDDRRAGQLVSSGVAEFVTAVAMPPVEQADEARSQSRRATAKP
jgi:hypothetical protein